MTTRADTLPAIRSVGPIARCTAGQGKPAFLCRPFLLRSGCYRYLYYLSDGRHDGTCADKEGHGKTIHIPLQAIHPTGRRNAGGEAPYRRGPQSGPGRLCPFSGYRVGAAARLASGRIITAANQESEVFPAGLCAERVLLFSHLATDPEDRITALAIASVPDDTECCPCGGCRQVMLDTMRRQGTPFRIIMSSEQSATVVDSPACLMPFPFGL